MHLNFYKFIIYGYINSIFRFRFNHNCQLNYQPTVYSHLVSVQLRGLLRTYLFSPNRNMKTSRMDMIFWELRLGWKLGSNNKNIFHL